VGQRRVARAGRLLAVIALGAGCSSCAEDYLVRRDTLAMGEGDAQRAEIAQQVIDPWPAASRVEVIDSNGERLQHAMEQYRNPSTNALSGGNGAVPASTVPVLK
jgi:hypothetical protein